MKRLIRRPRPDFTTACATMNAITTSSTLELAKPEYACAGVIVSVRTMAPTASIEAVSSGNAPISTDAMAAAKTANRCHAGAVSPAGTGQNQIPSAIAKGTACLRFNRSLVIWASSRWGRAERGLSIRSARPWIVPSSASITHFQENS